MKLRCSFDELIKHIFGGDLLCLIANFCILLGCCSHVRGSSSAAKALV